MYPERRRERRQFAMGPPTGGGGGGGPGASSNTNSHAASLTGSIAFASVAVSQAGTCVRSGSFFLFPCIIIIRIYIIYFSLMLRIAYGILCPRAHYAAQLTVTTPTASLLRSVDKNSGKFSSDADSGTGGIGEDIYGPM